METMLKSTGGDALGEPSSRLCVERSDGTAAARVPAVTKMKVSWADGFILYLRMQEVGPNRSVSYKECY